MKRLFDVYRVLALVVGVLLLLITLGVILKSAVQSGGWHDLGTTLTKDVATAHGFIYIGYVIVAFVLATRARWPIVFTVLMLLAGIVPGLVFYVERQVGKRMRAEHPEAFEPALR